MNKKLPSEVTTLFAEGLALHRAGRFTDAEQIYRQILATHHDHFDSRHMLGIAFYQRGSHAEAIDQIDTALQINPNNVLALNNLGFILHELKRFEEALASYDRVLAVRPDDAMALSNRGFILHKLKRFEEALAGYDRALAVRPDDAMALSNRGLTLHELKRFEEALASYDRALAVQPDDPGALSNRGLTLHELKRFEEALASYDRALAAQPHLAETLSNRGLTLHELRRFEEALASYDRALALRPDYARALSNRGLTHELRFHRRMARPGVFVDVGAHIGDFVSGMADMPGITCVAIEPMPHAFGLLRERVKGINPAVTLINAALSNRCGTSRLNVPVLSHGGPVSQWASITKNFAQLQADFPEIVAVQSFEVQLTTLDSSGLKPVSGIKIDAEGAEYEVLQGARQVLARMRPVITAELEERHRTGCTYSVPAFMDAFGYSCFFEIRGEFLPISQFDRVRMQRGSPSPASHEYSNPYVSCFYFLPAEKWELFDRIGVRYIPHAPI